MAFSRRCYKGIERKFDMIRLEDVNPDNWRLSLRVRDDQKAFVANSTVMLARAFAYRNSRSRAVVIYNDEAPIGMALYYDFEDAYNFSQFFIDERYQGKGFGYQAAEMILQEMEKDGVYDRVVLCYVEGDEAAKRLYLKLGFTHTGEEEEGEVVMERRLR